MTVAAASNPLQHKRKKTRSLIPDHMEGWPNDDLLLEAPARVKLESEQRGARRVFVWEALTNLFALFDEAAGKSRKDRQRAGLLAVLIAGAGSALSASLPLIGGDVSTDVFVLAAALSLIGLIWCLLLAVADPDKAEWLQHRLRTERLRQFYFQFMISDPALGAAAFTDDDAYARWQAKREEAVTVFQAWLQSDMRDELANVIRDVNHRHVWQTIAWETPPPAPPAGADLDAYFRLLRKQRVGNQIRYVGRKLEHGAGSPRTRHIANQALSYVLAIGTAALGGIAAWLVAEGAVLDQAPIPQMVSGIALLGVISITLKMLAEGQQLKAEVERFQWYLQAMQDVDGQLNNPDPAARVQAFREMEQIAYRDLRDFLKVHNDARFSFG